MKSRDVLAVFNRGRISPLALARTDVSRVALSAELQTNWLPRTLGAMSLRPGWGFKGELGGDGALLPFVYATDDTALLELTPGQMRVWDEGQALVTRPAVSAAVANGTFDDNINGWVDADDAGAVSEWSSLGAMRLLGTGYVSARRRQQVAVPAGEGGLLHALRIVVQTGPVALRIGSTAGSDDVFRQAILRTGTHSIAFVPGGSFWIELSSNRTYPTRVDSCAIEGAGVVTLPTIWSDAEACKLVRWQQSGDVVFAACRGRRPQRIERRPNNSWSVVDYAPVDGPFLPVHADNIRLDPSAQQGDITLTASRTLFEPGHVGALFSLTSQGQNVDASLSADLTYTDPVRVTGVGGRRRLRVSRGGNFQGTLKLQRSIGEPGAWVNVASYSERGTTDYLDDLDNVVAFYRLGFNANNHESGVARVTLDYGGGSITGVVQVWGYTSPTQVSARVLKALGDSDPTETWSEGAWSGVQGWPEAVGLSEGRLWWAGNGQIFGSVSDAFSTFDPDYEGDAGPINRRVGEGAVNRVNWMLPLQRLIVGTDGAEHSIRSNSLDEPITPSNFNSKAPSSRGSCEVPAVMADGRGYFVGRSREAVFEIEFDAARFDFGVLDATLLVPEIGRGEFVRLAIQQAPDTRLHAVRGDGTVAVLVRDRAEDVLCWVDVETDGIVEDVVVLPGAIEDRVFYRVARTIGGVTRRFLEEWAQERHCRGGAVNQQADAFVTGAGPVAGLGHLEGREVVVWGDGGDRGTGVVAGGAVAGMSFDAWCAGLPFEARYRSAKLAGQTGLGLSLTQRSRVDHIGLVLADTHARGVEFGPSFETMDALPLMEDGAPVDPDAVWESYDAGMTEFPGDWSTDNRICLRAAAPRPCTVLAAVLSVDRQDKS